MVLLNILKYPDEKLKNPSETVVKFDNNIVKLINDMFETMYFNKAIGLAATQVDIHKQLIVIESSKTKVVLVNPVLLEGSGKDYSEEACLSIPNIVGFVVRTKSICIGTFDVKGYMYRIKANGILSICIQHEVEHLFGFLNIYR
ncbi:peptide deformylase [Candidatus Tremblaya phenacola]|nr:peptide deformylase [Candidatus Tremblaya phenacola]